VVDFAPWPSFTSEEINAVSNVLASNRVNYWTGEICKKFETEFAAWAGCKRAVALANGTAALEVALKALGIGPGDEVITSPRTFIATASAIVLAGATPVFADVDRDTQNITADSISKVLTERTKAIICVHLAGMPCDMDPIMALAKDRQIKVIEDCAQAHGARYKGRSVGSIGHIGAWSFCQDKIITTVGEGGMVTTSDEKLWSAMWSYKDHGRDWDAVHRQEHPPGPRLIYHGFGTNWRMLELQAAVGLLQLGKMPDWTARRTELARRLAETCGKHPVLRVPSIPANCGHAFYRFYAFVVPSKLRRGWSRDKIVEAVTAERIPCFQGSAPEIYLEKAFDGTGWRPNEPLPIARELGQTSIAFLVHPTITNSQIDRACVVIGSVLSAAGAD
jgi:dTDP-4-amino-4,6-dideoxygalactose transaminase